MFVIHLLLLALNTVIFPDPGMQRVFVHPEVTRGLGNGLSRLHGQFHRAFLEGGGVFLRHRLAHRTHLVCCMMSLSPCVRKSIATSLWLITSTKSPQPRRTWPDSRVRRKPLSRATRLMTRMRKNWQTGTTPGNSNAKYAS